MDTGSNFEESLLPLLSHTMKYIPDLHRVTDC